MKKKTLQTLIENWNETPSRRTSDIYAFVTGQREAAVGHSNPVSRFLLPNAFFTALSGFEGLHVAPKKFVVASNNSFFLAKGNLVDFNKRKTPTNVFFFATRMAYVDFEGQLWNCLLNKIWHPASWNSPFACSAKFVDFWIVRMTWRFLAAVIYVFRSSVYVMFIFLVGGFNPIEKYQSKWTSSPNRGENKNYSKPLTSFPFISYVGVKWWFLGPGGSLRLQTPRDWWPFLLSPRS